MLDFSGFTDSTPRLKAGFSEQALFHKSSRRLRLSLKANHEYLRMSFHFINTWSRASLQVCVDSLSLCLSVIVSLSLCSTCIYSLILFHPSFLISPLFLSLSVLLLSVFLSLFLPVSLCLSLCLLASLSHSVLCLCLSISLFAPCVAPTISFLKIIFLFFFLPLLSFSSILSLLFLLYLYNNFFRWLSVCLPICLTSPQIASLYAFQFLCLFSLLWMYLYLRIYFSCLFLCVLFCWSQFLFSLRDSNLLVGSSLPLSSHYFVGPIVL